MRHSRLHCNTKWWYWGIKRSGREVVERIQVEFDIQGRYLWWLPRLRGTVFFLLQVLWNKEMWCGEENTELCLLHGISLRKPEQAFHARPGGEGRSRRNKKEPLKGNASDKVVMVSWPHTNHENSQTIPSLWQREGGEGFCQTIPQSAFRNPKLWYVSRETFPIPLTDNIG